MAINKTKIIILALTILLYMPLTTLAYTSSGPWTKGIENVGADSGLPGNFSSGGDPVEPVITYFLKWLLLIFIILAFISFVITGLMFLLAGANKDMADKARKGVMYSIIAVAVAFSAYIIIILIDSLLRGGSSV